MGINVRDFLSWWVFVLVLKMFYFYMRVVRFLENIIWKNIYNVEKLLRI